MRLSFAFVVAVVAVVALRDRANAACGSEYFRGVAERLSAIEARADRSIPAALARDAELEALVSSPEAPVRRAIEQPCIGQTRTLAARDVARARTFELWAKLLALDEVSAPIYPRPYVRACERADVRSWQVAFIAAWVARLRPDALVAPAAIRAALEVDTRYAHVRDLALASARRLHVDVVRETMSGDDEWLAQNERARARDAAAAGAPCGPAMRLWALTPSQPVPEERQQTALAP